MATPAIEWRRATMAKPVAPHDYVYRVTKKDGVNKSVRCRVVWIDDIADFCDDAEVMYMLDVPGEEDLVPHEGELELIFPKIRVARSAHGLGVWAMGAISKGEVVLREKPLVTSFDVIQVNNDFFRNPLPLQMAIMGLNDPEATDDTGDNHHLKFPENYKREDQKTVTSVFMNNRIPNGDGPIENVAQSSLYAVICRLNHSCVPNVLCYWDKEAEEEVVVALEDIAEGDELLMSYMTEYCTDDEARKKKVLENFFFDCDCPLCNATATDSQKSLYATGKMAEDALQEATRRLGNLPPIGARQQEKEKEAKALAADPTFVPKTYPTDEIQTLMQDALAACGDEPHFRYFRREFQKSLSQLDKWLNVGPQTVLKKEEEETGVPTTGGQESVEAAEDLPTLEDA